MLIRNIQRSYTHIAQIIFSSVEHKNKPPEHDSLQNTCRTFVLIAASLPSTHTQIYVRTYIVNSLNVCIHTLGRIPYTDTCSRNKTQTLSIALLTEASFYHRRMLSNIKMYTFIHFYVFLDIWPWYVSFGN